jgi:hypothetical protein
MNLELDMEPIAHDDGEAEHQHRLPAELSLLTLARCRDVGVNEPAPHGPFAQLISRKPSQFQDIPRSDQAQHYPPVRVWRPN